MLYILIAILAVIAVGYFIARKVHAASSIFAVGVLLLMIAVATGRIDHSTADIESTGNAFYDELLITESLFKSRFSGTGMAIMVLFGFVGYMRHIGADAKTVVALSSPLRRFDGSYWLVPIGFLVATLLSFVVPSASALALLLVATLMPALIASGLTPLTTILVVNPKGGTGKTTVADELVFGFQARRYRTGFINLDNQGGAIHDTDEESVLYSSDVVVIDTPGRLDEHTTAWDDVCKRCRRTDAIHGRVL